MKYRQEWKKMRSGKLGFPWHKDFQRNRNSICSITSPERVTHGCINNQSEGQNQHLEVWDALRESPSQCSTVTSIFNSFN